MKIIAYNQFKPGVTTEGIRPDVLREEMSRAWRLQKAGVIRETYGRADVPGGVIVFECASVDEAKEYVAAFPLWRAGLLEWKFLPLTAPLPFEVLFTPIEGKSKAATTSLMACDVTDAAYEALVGKTDPLAAE